MRACQSSILFASVLAAACATRNDLAATFDSAGAVPGAAGPGAALAEAPLGRGEARLAVPGGRIWYKTSGAGPGTPVVLLHGGPGFSSFYLKPLEELGDERPVVRYDQLGSGKSDHVQDTAAFYVGHFVRELDSLRAYLGHARLHLVGHSWGTVLALEYYRAHPDRVVSLTLASPCLDVPAWQRHGRTLIATLSDSAQRAISAREVDRRFDAPDYQTAVAEFYGKYVFRRPVPADVDSTMSSFSHAVYEHMWGPSEFTVAGTLERYDATPFLKEINVPTLFTVGEFDEAGPEIVRRQAAGTPGARFALIPNAAHITTWDNPAAMLRAVREFLKAADPVGSRARR